MGACFSIDQFKKNRIKTIKKIIKIASTGDLVLFSGKSNTSNCVRIFSNEPIWSHVGLVYVDLKTRQKFIFESTFSLDEFDYITGSDKDGVRLSDMETKLIDYNGNIIALRKLKIDKELINPDDIINSLIKTINETTSNQYTKSISELLSSVNGTNTKLTKDFFCCKLAAYTLQQMGILSKTKLPNNYALVDFSTKGHLEYVNEEIAIFDEEYYAFN